MFFVLYMNLNHKDTTKSLGERLDTTLYIDENVSQTCQPKIFKTWKLLTFLFKKQEDFSLNREILRSRYKMDPGLYLYNFSETPHRQKFF